MKSSTVKVIGLVNYTNPVDGVTLTVGKITEVPAESVGYLVADGWGREATQDEQDQAVVDAAFLAAMEAEHGPVTDVQIVEPARTGRGSGAEVWAAFLTGRGVTFPDGSDRDGMIAAWDATQAPAADEVEATP